MQGSVRDSKRHGGVGGAAGAAEFICRGLRRFPKTGGAMLSSVGEGWTGVSPPVTNSQILKVLAAQQTDLSRKQDPGVPERLLIFQQLSRFFQHFFPNSTFSSTASCELLLLFRGPAAGGSKTLSNFLDLLP